MGEANIYILFLADLVLVPPHIKIIQICTFVKYLR